MVDAPEQIASLLIPTLGRPLLVPNVAVAEIINWKQPQAVRDAPSWLLGSLEWRGVALPVLSLELMNDPNTDAVEACGGKRLAVINSQGNAPLPFYGIAVQGIPRLIRVFADELEQQDSSMDVAFDTLVIVSGERAVIPDLNAIEDALSSILSA